MTKLLVALAECVTRHMKTPGSPLPKSELVAIVYEWHHEATGGESDGSIADDLREACVATEPVERPAQTYQHTYVLTSEAFDRLMPGEQCTILAHCGKTATVSMHEDGRGWTSRPDEPESLSDPDCPVCLEEQGSSDTAIDGLDAAAAGGAVVVNGRRYRVMLES